MSYIIKVFLFFLCTTSGGIAMQSPILSNFTLRNVIIIVIIINIINIACAARYTLARIASIFMSCLVVMESYEWKRCLERSWNVS